MPATWGYVQASIFVLHLECMCLEFLFKKESDLIKKKQLRKKEKKVIDSHVHLDICPLHITLNFLKKLLMSFFHLLQNFWNLLWIRTLQNCDGMCANWVKHETDDKGKRLKMKKIKLAYTYRCNNLLICLASRTTTSKSIYSNVKQNNNHMYQCYNCVINHNCNNAQQTPEKQKQTQWWKSTNCIAQA